MEAAEQMGNDLGDGARFPLIFTFLKDRIWYYLWGITLNAALSFTIISYITAYTASPLA